MDAARGPGFGLGLGRPPPQTLLTAAAHVHSLPTGLFRDRAEGGPDGRGGRSPGGEGRGAVGHAAAIATGRSLVRGQGPGAALWGGHPTGGRAAPRAFPRQP
eukprot:5396059-Alexandrium_andersonii.AAC.1